MKRNKLHIVTRSCDPDLYRKSSEFLDDRCVRTAYKDTARFAGSVYWLLDVFYNLKNRAKWVVSVDEDCFLLNLGEIRHFVNFLDKAGYDYAGIPDGGVVPCRIKCSLYHGQSFAAYNLESIRAKLPKAKKPISHLTYGPKCNKRIPNHHPIHGVKPSNWHGVPEELLQTWGPDLLKLAPPVNDFHDNMPERKDVIEANQEHKDESWSMICYWMLRNGLKPYNIKAKHGFIKDEGWDDEDTASLYMSQRNVPIAVHAWFGNKIRRQPKFRDAKTRMDKLIRWSKKSVVTGEALPFQGYGI